MKCIMCLKKEAEEKICKTCLSELIALRLIDKNKPEYHIEEIRGLFEDMIKPQMDEIIKELDRIKLELRIKRMKRKKHA